MEEWEKLKNSNVKVFYRDVGDEGRESVSYKTGKFLGMDKFFVYISTSGIFVAIPQKIVKRIEGVSE